MDGGRLRNTRRSRVSRAAPDSHRNREGVVRGLGGMAVPGGSPRRAERRTLARDRGSLRGVSRGARGCTASAFIARQTHAWAVADRIAFGEAPYSPAPAVLAPRRPPSSSPAADRPAVAAGPWRFHGERALRRRPASGSHRLLTVLAACGLRRCGGGRGRALLDGRRRERAGVGAHIPEFRQLLIRATLRRILELDEHNKRGRPRFEEHLREYERTVAIIEGM